MSEFTTIRILAMPAISHDADLISKNDLAHELGVCRRTVDNWTDRGLLPQPRKIGYVVRYVVSEVNEHLDKQQKEAVPA